MTEPSVASLDTRLQKRIEGARTAFERGDYAHTIELTREVLAVAPGCLPVRKLQRTAQLKRGAGEGRWAKARGAILAAVAWLGGRSGLASDPAKAFARAQQVLEADPNNLAGLRLLGRAAGALGWPETAVFAFELVRERAPDDFANLVALGRAQLDAAHADAAIRCAEAVLARTGTHGAAQALLKDASVAHAMQTGRWAESGDFRTKVKS